MARPALTDCQTHDVERFRLSRVGIGALNKEVEGKTRLTYVCRHADVIGDLAGGNVLAHPLNVAVESGQIIFPFDSPCDSKVKGCSVQHHYTHLLSRWPDDIRSEKPTQPTLPPVAPAPPIVAGATTSCND